MLRVVVVDADAEARRLVRLWLHVDGAAKVVAEVGTGDAALDVIGTHQPDVAIIDLHPPGLSGLEVIERLRAAGQPPRVVAFCADDRVLASAFTAGADAAVLKGGLLERLTIAIRG